MGARRNAGRARGSGTAGWGVRAARGRESLSEGAAGRSRGWMGMSWVVLEWANSAFELRAPGTGARGGGGHIGHCPGAGPGELV
jgi:hypothetical protein